ncbi:MAG: membrane protein [Bacteroidia bacterium]|nr:MAG: membrane protein [Bacteroidia bacterium]
MNFLSRPKLLFALLFRYFLRGVFLFLPALATLYILWVLLRWLDNIIPTGFPGLGSLILIVGLTLLGYLSTHWIGPSLINFIENRIRKIPFIGFIYSSIRDLIENSRRSVRFDRPVLVRLHPQSETYQLGFLTHENPLPPLPLVAVYLPYALSFMGQLVFVPRDQIQEIPMKGAEALRFVISGGLVTPTESADGKAGS